MCHTFSVVLYEYVPKNEVSITQLNGTMVIQVQTVEEFLDCFQKQLSILQFISVVYEGSSYSVLSSSILVDGKWCLCVLICVSFAASHTEHLFLCFLDICVYPLETCVKRLSFFACVCIELLFIIQLEESLNVIYIYIQLHMFCTYFPSSCELPFYFLSGIFLDIKSFSL